MAHMISLPGQRVSHLVTGGQHIQLLIAERFHRPQGTWLCELCLWANWEYRGTLEATDMVHYMVSWRRRCELARSSQGGPPVVTRYQGCAETGGEFPGIHGEKLGSG